MKAIQKLMNKPMSALELLASESKPTNMSALELLASENKPTNMSALELLASENKPSLTETAQGKQLSGRPQSLKECPALMKLRNKR